MMLVRYAHAQDQRAIRAGLVTTPQRDDLDGIRRSLQQRRDLARPGFIDPVDLTDHRLLIDLVDHAGQRIGGLMLRISAAPWQPRQGFSMGARVSIPSRPGKMSVRA